MKRREFLNIGLLTGATAALAGCGRTPEQAFMSEAMMPEFYLPGIAQWYATTCGECGGGCGLGVRNIGGRAKKVEGIPTHPLSRGGHCVRAESALQALYNPDRLTAPVNNGTSVPIWDTAIDAVAGLMGGGGDALWITGPLRGTEGAVVIEAARRMGAKLWVLDFPGTRVERAAMRAIGGTGLPWYDLAEADYVVNFGGDFLGTGENQVEASWAYGQFRNGASREQRGILVSFCSRMNLTVSNSDKWIPVRPGSEGFVAAAVAGLLGKRVPGRVTTKEAAKQAGIDERLIVRLANKLRDAKRPIAVGGYENAAYSNGFWSLAAINALNRALGNTATFEPDVVLPAKGASVSVPPDMMISAKAAVDGLGAGRFKAVVVSGDANPVYLLPKKLGIGEALKKTRLICLTPFINETAAQAEWVLPTTTWLEKWGDARVEGPASVYGIIQPVVSPREGSQPLGEILLQAMAKAGKPMAGSMMELVSGRFNRQDWLKALERGGVWKPASLDWDYYHAPPIAPPPPESDDFNAAQPDGPSIWAGLRATAPSASAEAEFHGQGEFVLVPYPTAILQDGSLTNRPWLPEIPDPVTQAVWSSWVEVNSEVAHKLGIHPIFEGGKSSFEVVQVTSENGTLELPVIGSPTVHPEVAAVPMGYGHQSLGRYAYGKGFNPMDIVTPDWQAGTDELVWASTKVTINRTGKRTMFTTYDRRYTEGAERELEL